MIYIYNLLVAVLTTAAAPYLVYRLLRGADSLPALRQKLGSYNFPAPSAGGLWIHAVSVGEVNSAVVLVEELLRRNPDMQITVSTSTATGMEIASSKLSGKTALLYFPYDLPPAVGSALSFVNPGVVVFMETEIWPNFIRTAHGRGVKLMLANGRISDASFKSYDRLKFLFAPFVRLFDRALMQSQTDAERIRKIGAKDESVVVAGNLKFDRPVPPDVPVKEVRDRFNIPAERPVALFASTHPGEDEIFLAVLNKLLVKFGGLYAVIAPRHPHRAESIRGLCEAHGLAPRLRTENAKDPGSALVLDTIGELASLYPAVDVAVMGGSFVPHGGQNPLEPAVCGVPVLFGPHMQNFREISEKLSDSGGGIPAKDADELAVLLERLLSDAGLRRKTGDAGRKTVSQNRGALQKTVEAIGDLFKNKGGSMEKNSGH